jgi:hypothetical protein
MKALRIAHGWRLVNHAQLPLETVRDFVRAPARAVPPALAARVGFCSIEILPLLDPPELSSRSTAAPRSLEIELAAGGIEPHDLAMELLISIAHRAWERTAPAEREAWLRLLASEIDSATGGEIDEEVLELKRALLASRAAARSAVLIERYAAASFAATLAEYVHCLWHDVIVRSGPAHLDPTVLRCRLQLLVRWFPPGRGRRLFALERG